MAQRPDSAEFQCCNEQMKKALSNLRVELVKELEVDRLLEPLDSMFPGGLNYIKAYQTKENRVRKFLEGLTRRPESTFWTFITALFDFGGSQRDVADRILKTYEQLGGQVSESVACLQREYGGHPQLQEGQLPQSGQPQGTQAPHSLHHQLHLQQPPEQGQQSWCLDQQQRVPEETASRRQNTCSSARGPLLVQLSAKGMPITTVEDSRSSAGTMMTTEIETSATVADPFGSRGAEEGAVGGGRVQSPVQAAEANVYRDKRNNEPDLVYSMESMPRGAALIINNERFHTFTHRAGTARDCQMLAELFQHKLGFEVHVRNDLTAEKMQREISNFLRHLTQGRFDSCMVGILTHGMREEALFGIDGRLTSGRPAQGTYITTHYLTERFGSRNCPVMAGKPKLFIIQACRGDQQGAHHGQQPNPFDLPQVENEATPDRNLADKMDVLFFYATVPRHVAIRNFFIPTLVNIFRLHAGSKHLLELHTLIVQEMSKAGSENSFTISEGNTRLSRLWYLNPPHSSSREI